MATTNDAPRVENGRPSIAAMKGWVGTNPHGRSSIDSSMDGLGENSSSSMMSAICTDGGYDGGSSSTTPSSISTMESTSSPNSVRRSTATAAASAAVANGASLLSNLWKVGSKNKKKPGKTPLQRQWSAQNHSNLNAAPSSRYLDSSSRQFFN